MRHQLYQDHIEPSRSRYTLQEHMLNNGIPTFGRHIELNYRNNAILDLECSDYYPSYTRSKKELTVSRLNTHSSLSKNEQISKWLIEQNLISKHKETEDQPKAKAKAKANHM